MSKNQFCFFSLSIFILIFSSQKIVVKAETHYDFQFHDCGAKNVQKVIIEGCESESTEKICVTTDAYPLKYHIVFVTPFDTETMLNNETISQTFEAINETINHSVGDFCDNFQKFGLDCPVAQNTELRLNKVLRPLYKKLTPQEPILYEDQYYSTDAIFKKPALVACARFFIVYHEKRNDSTTTTTTTETSKPTPTPPDDDDDMERSLKQLIDTLEQSEVLVNKTEDRIKKYFQDHPNAENNTLIKLLRIELLQSRFNIADIWLEIEPMKHTNQEVFQLFVEKSIETLWKHSDRIRLILAMLDEFGWNNDEPDDINDSFKRNSKTILHKLLNRLDSVQSLLKRKHNPTKQEKKDLDSIEKYIKQIEEYENMIDHYDPQKMTIEVPINMLIYVRKVEVALFRMENDYQKIQ